MKLFFLLGTLILGVLSCTEPAVVFTEPQPNGGDLQIQIPPVYRGVFLCESDSSIVHVRGKVIYKEKNIVLKLTLEDLKEEESLSIVEGQLEIKNWPGRYPVDIVGDTMYAEVKIQDTLFKLSEKNLLKEFRGHQILNKKLGENKWEVQILSLDADLDLRLTMAFLPEDLNRLQEITPVKDISTEGRFQLLLNPDLAAFQQILKERLVFQECDLFIRLKPVLEI